MKLRVRRTSPRAVIPRYAHPGDSGLDLHACLDGDILIPSGAVRLIGTGVAFEIPDGFEGQVRGRSGHSKRGILVHGGTIDAPYRGEVKVCIQNLSPNTITIEPGERVAQIVIAPVARVELVEVDALSESERGEGGFGSTGR